MKGDESTRKNSDGRSSGVEFDDSTADRCSCPDKKSTSIVLSSPAGLSVGQTVLLSLYYDYPSEGSSKGRESCAVSSSLFQHELQFERLGRPVFSSLDEVVATRAEKGNERERERERERLHQNSSKIKFFRS